MADISSPNYSGFEVFRSKDGSEVAVRAATWRLNPKITFESLAEEFRRNPLLAWRNYGSVISFKIEAAIKDKEAVLRNVTTARMGHPWDEAHNRFYDWFRGKPGNRYFYHFDLSQNKDAVGLALSHREKDGSVTTDFMRQHRPVPGVDINYAQLREWYIYPLTARGFHIELITYDRWGSVETIQILNEKGYTTGITSADKTMGPYDTLIEMLLTHRWNYYSYPSLIRELEELRLVNGMKYDHPRKFSNGQMGSKDVADACASSVFDAVQYQIDNPPEQPGKLKIIPGAKLWQPTYGEPRGSL